MIAFEDVLRLPFPTHLFLFNVLFCFAGGQEGRDAQSRNVDAVEGARRRLTTTAIGTGGMTSFGEPPKHKSPGPDETTTKDTVRPHLWFQ